MRVPTGSGSIPLLPNPNIRRHILKTEIILILDRSGSMQTVWGSTIEGVNKFIAEQQKEEGECALTIYQFDHEFDYEARTEDIQSHDFLTNKSYVPRGATALHDAICEAIDTTRVKIVAKDKEYRPDNVICVIMTDGHENSSTRFTMADVNKRISKMTNKGWDFVFLGANQDAIATAKGFGIGAGKSMTIQASDSGMQASYSSMNTYLSNVRSGSVALADNCFSAEDREAQKVNHNH